MTLPGSKMFLRLLAVALLHSAVLGWMVWDRVTLLQNGRKITLAVRPLDPRDFFRGDYIILTFDINRIRVWEVVGDKKFNRSDDIFVGLKRADDGSWHATAIYHTPPEISADIVFIKGRVTRALNLKKHASRIPTGRAPVCHKAECVRLYVKYGIEKYFVPEGDGLRLEALRNDKVLSIAVAVSTTGKAGIKALLVRGKSVYDEPLF